MTQLKPFVDEMVLMQSSPSPLPSDGHLNLDDFTAFLELRAALGNLSGTNDLSVEEASDQREWKTCPPSDITQRVLGMPYADLDDFLDADSMNRRVTLSMRVAEQLVQISCSSPLQLHMMNVFSEHQLWRLSIAPAIIILASYSEDSVRLVIYLYNNQAIYSDPFFEVSPPNYFDSVLECLQQYIQ